MLSLLLLTLVTFSWSTVIDAPLSAIDYQQNPTSIEWKKIDSEHFEIIFPAEIENQAQRVTHLLEKAYPFVTRSLEVVPPKISLILQNQTTISNGFVTLAPRRSEWNVTPAIDPSLTNTEWLKTLSIHEFRHIVQFQKSRQHLNRWFEIFLGQVGQALGIGLSMPPWFLEGDAVGMETALTSGGRGRLPLFERDLRTLLLSGKKFNYDKSHLGSYKDYLPNHYVFGYFYTSFMRSQQGDLFLSKLINKSTVDSWNPLTFYRSYKDLTSQEFEFFYRDSMKELISIWKKKLDKLPLTPYEVKNLVKRDVWTNYRYPQLVGKNKFLALKSGLAHIDQFVLLDGKKEKTIFYPGILVNEYPYKLRNGKLAYAELEVDPRWGVRDYSRIRVFDFKTKEHVLDLRKTKGRLAVLNEAASNVLYVDWDEKQGQRIVVVDLKGKQVYNLNYPQDQVITSLDWLKHNEVVMVVKDHLDLKRVVKVSLLNGDQESLLPPTMDNLGFISCYNGKILVESPTSGIDNIFEIKEGSLRQLTSSRYGAYAPDLKQGKLFYNDYTVDGMNISEKKMDWEQEEKTSDSFHPFYEKFAEAEKKDELEKSYFEQEKYPVQSYSQVKQAINLHSWVILAPPLSSTITLQGISRDVLNKFSLSVGADYNLNERTAKGFVTASWSHLYPVLDLRGAYGSRRQDVRLGGRKIHNQWEEGSIEGGLQVPWKRISGRFIQSFNTRLFSRILKVTNKISSSRTQVNDGALFSPGAQVSYRVTSRLAARDLNPAWGMTVFGQMEEGRDITGVDQKGSIKTADGRIFLPGVLPHHSFYHQLAYEKQKDDSYQYASYIFYPRGTRSFFLDEMSKYSANYLFPLFYPDYNLSKYYYLKRLSINFFYDELKGRYRGYNYFAASTGWEVLFESNFLRIFIPLTIGVRGNYVLHGEEKRSYDIFLNTPLGDF